MSSVNSNQKRMLITGATSGIGLELAKQAVDHGWKVTACGRNPQKLNELKKSLMVETILFDVTNGSETAHSLLNVEWDIAVLNAGTCEYVDIEKFEPAMFKRVFDTNFFGVINCVAALLRSSGAGKSFVIVDSMARMFPFTRAEAYGSSKAALHYFAQSLKVDLATKGVNVQTVSPGFVETPLTDENDFDMPMLIGVEEAAQDLLKGIEQGKDNITFPTRFSLIMKTLNLLPSFLQVYLSKKMRPRL
ncbi:SDR family NAD(P)-dependent oxidoreductase [Alteromonas sp. ASW11-130]|uniref:SDR family NAD(P)-dependent oxidoreductase n=1 Tax=Alteromonas sp. ASW11-130 TaxID=3015775 RepID=UPI002242C14C|nr:SDR family NAD(P)-dependent oxidoreductase [Alteromonas sp. ASW11-130]MCW8093022.1 SDR family NAD(P)-dependent oxidoreductase [Alteromonas sp. ASW11-130]